MVVIQGEGILGLSPYIQKVACFKREFFRARTSAAVTIKGEKH